jgi:hypothetical protein
MYRSVVVAMSLAICGVLAGCTSSTTIFVQARSTHLLSSGTIEANATFPIARPGTYHYKLTFARAPIQAGAQPQVCLPIGDFELIDKNGDVTPVVPPRSAADVASGSIYLTAGTWTGVTEGSTTVGGVYGPLNPPGTYWGLACPWALTLTPSN